MKNWFKNLSKESIQRIVFFGLLAVLFVAFFISLQLVDTETPANPEEPGIENPGNEPNEENPGEKPNVKEKFMAPTLSEKYNVLRTYFDSSLEESELEKAVMKYENGKYICSLGISLGMEDDSTFEVVATMSGVVSSVSTDSLYGTIVTITHENGYTSEYSSLSEVNVKVGDSIAQGDKIGLSGVANVDSEASNHVYFIVRKDSKTINPLTLFGKTIEELEN